MAAKELWSWLVGSAVGCAHSVKRWPTCYDWPAGARINSPGSAALTPAQWQVLHLSATQTGPVCPVSSWSLCTAWHLAWHRVC